MRKLNQRRGRDSGTRRRSRIGCEVFCSSFLFFDKDVFLLIIDGSKYIQRLMDCGWMETSAVEICQKFAADGDFSGMKEFVRQQELLYDDRKQYV